jgi:hypothetical protein
MTTLGEGRSVCRTIQTTCISGRGVPTRCENWHRCNTVGENRLKPCRGRPFGLQAELESERKREIPVVLSGRWGEVAWEARRPS